MLYTTIIYSKKDHIARVTLNRPKANNTINQELARELTDACHLISQDDDIYVAIITGTGEKAFCSGSDPEDAGASHSAATSLASIPQPVIAAINGDALGQGLELALACDIRLASKEARFGFPQIAQGFIPTNGGTQRLPRTVGKGKAIELILTAETISAEEAFEIGLVSKVINKENLASEVEALAKVLVSKAPIALRYVKEAVNKGLDLTLEQGLRLEADLYFLLQTTSDRSEGITTFLQKRRPDFKSK